MLNLVLALASGAVMVLLYPEWDFHFLAAVALVPLLIAAARESSAKRRFLIGQAAGILYWFGACYWVEFVLEQHGGMDQGLAWLAFTLFCFAKALHLAVFTALAGPLFRRWYAIPAVAALWTGIERTHSPLGFAWLLLGNAGIDMSVPMRMAPLTGVYGLSFVFAVLNGALAVLILQRGRRALAPVLMLPLLVLLPALPPPGDTKESAVAVQPAIAQDAPKWDQNTVFQAIQKVSLLSLQEALARDQPEAALLLWPESPAPFYFYSDKTFQEEARRLARLVRRPFLFGTVAHSLDNHPLNSAVMLDPGGEVVSRYDKMFLVPFGEFVPPLFGWVNRITQEAGDFEPGRQVVVSRTGGHVTGAFICYESAFPHLVRRFTAEGADLLVNLSNDGYFGRTSARGQHLLLARMRAAENGRWLLRPTNDGITASIDPAGRLRARLPAYEATAGRLPFDWTSATTLYTRTGDWFAWLCLAGGLIACAWNFIQQSWPTFRP